MIFLKLNYVDLVEQWETSEATIAMNFSLYEKPPIPRKNDVYASDLGSVSAHESYKQRRGSNGRVGVPAQRYVHRSPALDHNQFNSYQGNAISVDHNDVMAANGSSCEKQAWNDDGHQQQQQQYEYQEQPPDQRHQRHHWSAGDGVLADGDFSDRLFNSRKYSSDSDDDPAVLLDPVGSHLEGQFTRTLARIVQYFLVLCKQIHIPSDERGPAHPRERRTVPGVTGETPCPTEKLGLPSNAKLNYQLVNNNN